MGNLTIERVAAGVEMLDALQPGWRDRINVEAFDVCTSDQCVLGQLFGDYATGLDLLGLRGHEGSDYGFNLSAKELLFEGDEDPWDPWGELQDAWLSVFSGKFNDRVREARNWISDCIWRDLEEGGAKGMKASKVIRGVNRHYEGGWDAFVADIQD